MVRKSKNEGVNMETAAFFAFGFACGILFVMIIQEFSVPKKICKNQIKDEEKADWWKNGEENPYYFDD